jgi:hypothetical protein
MPANKLKAARNERAKDRARMACYAYVKNGCVPVETIGRRRLPVNGVVSSGDKHSKKRCGTVEDWTPSTTVYRAVLDACCANQEC